MKENCCNFHSHLFLKYKVNSGRQNVKFKDMIEPYGRFIYVKCLEVSSQRGNYILKTNKLKLLRTHISCDLA